MDTRPRRTASVVLRLLIGVAAASCSTTQPPNDRAVCDAYSAQRSHVEVVADGTVTRMLGVAPGRVSPHEGFLLRLASGCSLVVRVEVNTDFTGTIPIAQGQRVSVKGEYEFYPRGGVVHWTHRDPRGRHEGGYIEAGGQLYE
ncbi:MAG TPA: DUF3465 domain-containing protein [Candidatus Binatia bacterium]|nr:DUF3465 domain-containing protein [Candidatus Binatia bacterium]